jgi:dTDP-4-amino-4,6-dideoxygalactose transaminase
MSELDCAMMMVKTRHIDTWQKRRESIAGYWIERLKESNTRCLITKDNFHDHAFHKFVIELDNRDRIQKELTSRKIETRVHYVQPLHEIGTFRQYQGPDLLSAASSLSRRVLSLPLYPELSDLAVEYIIDQVLDLSATEHN